MIPITRKELYLNKIVGNDDYDIPEKPIIEEEFFFAEILGEAVQAPEPLTRYQMYLAKIAGSEIEIPYPEVRLEYFLARAAGMDIETPTPITREEIFWSNYTAIVEFELEGVPPLTYTAKEGTLQNYRIYGQTSRNLFDEKIYNKNVANNTSIYVPIYVGNVNYVTCSTTCPKTIDKDNPDNDNFNSRYIFILSGNVNAGAINDVNGVSNGAPRTIQPSNKYVTICYRKIESNNVRPWEYQTMLNTGATPLPYEPYGESVGDKTVNVLPLSRTPITETHGDFLCEYDGLGTITLTTDKDNATTDGKFVIPLIHDFTIPVSIGQGGTGCLQINNDAYGSQMGEIQLKYNTTVIDVWKLSSSNRVNSSYGMMGNTTINNVAIQITNGGIYQKITIRPAFVENVTEQVPFEPYGYRVPVTVSNGTDTLTTPIYLPEQIKKVGDEAEYIDYGQQKQHFADGTETDVTLPALPTLTGTNVLSVGTAVQPSKVYVKYKGERQ